MKKSLLGSLLSAALLAMTHTSAHAFDPFTVKDIRVEGIQRTDAGTVFSYLPVKVGETMTDELASQAVKALFATGFFKDVRLEIENDVLVVVIEERPAVGSLDFVGMKALEKDQIRKGLRDVGLAESRIFDRAVVERAEQELKRQYLSRGYYAVNITTTITPLERNRVGVNFSIDEGRITKIRQINIVGNKVFKEKDLLSVFNLTTPTWFTWYTKNDQYSKQKLSGDLESLRSYYLDRGYLEFSVDSTQVTISPDKQDIYITINVSEGEKYTVSSFKLAGDLLIPEAELRKMVKVKPGDPYSRAAIADTTKAISDRLGNDGYAFANVNAAPELNKEKREVAFTLFVDPGRRVYVRSINVTGNNRTRDEVVRREMRQMEGAWYDGDRINKSRNRVDRLGYFDQVSVETPAVPGTSDQVDVNVNVKEKATGFVMLGAGFSSSEKLSLSGSVTQQNLFGSGKTVSVGVNTSKINTVYSLSYTNPYYTVDGISAGFDVYQRNVNTRSLSIARYRTNSMGGGLRIGVPISDTDYLGVGLAVDTTTLTVNDDPNSSSRSPQRYIDFVKKNGSDYSSLVPTINWSRNSIDSRIYPTDGTIAKVAAEFGVPPGSLEYYKLTAQYSHYWPLSRSITLYTNAELGYADSLGDKEYPFFKNFYAGGIGSVRGYDTGTLGPYDKDPSFRNGIQRLGGTRKAVGTVELLFPMPGTGPDKSVRLGTFFDFGQVWGADQKIALGDMRYSAGVSILWASPMGPLKFSFGVPLNKQEGDKAQMLQFTMGQVF
ncbi:MAG TPA: outer membrane protein assembly factor BamA [Rhodocyclaceae bacterium]|nr:outer membrane protein assembly factor BamA [Rhodocyclaceae bacterium]